MEPGVAIRVNDIIEKARNNGGILTPSETLLLIQVAQAQMKVAEADNKARSEEKVRKAKEWFLDAHPAAVLPEGGIPFAGMPLQQ